MKEPNFGWGYSLSSRIEAFTDSFICCVDGLTGFVEAIETVYPEAKVQLSHRSYDS